MVAWNTKSSVCNYGGPKISAAAMERSHSVDVPDVVWHTFFFVRQEFQQTQPEGEPVAVLRTPQVLGVGLVQLDLQLAA